MRAIRGAVAAVVASAVMMASGGVARAAVPTTVSLDAIPPVVTWGQPVAYSGFVDCGDQALSGVPVVLQFSNHDGTVFRELVTSTDIVGGYTIAERPSRSAFVQAVFGGFGECAAGASPRVRMQVRPGVIVNAPRIGFFGRSVSISGFVAPSHAFGFVDLQILDGARGVWRYVATRRLGRFSNYRFSYANHSVTPYLLFRVVFRGDLDHAANASRNVRIDWLFPAL